MAMKIPTHVEPLIIRRLVNICPDTVDVLVACHTANVLSTYIISAKHSH